LRFIAFPALDSTAFYNGKFGTLASRGMPPGSLSASCLFKSRLFRLQNVNLFETYTSVSGQNDARRKYVRAIDTEGAGKLNFPQQRDSWHSRHSWTQQRFS